MPIDSLTGTMDWRSGAGSVFILVAAAQLAMKAALLLSMEAALGVEITASLSAFRMGRPVRSGVSKHMRMGFRRTNKAEVLADEGDSEEDGFDTHLEDDTSLRG